MQQCGIVQELPQILKKLVKHLEFIKAQMVEKSGLWFQHQQVAFLREKVLVESV